jgi:hypothetical protein
MDRPSPCEQFPLQELEIVNIRDCEDDFVKLVEVRVGIVVQHTCFPQPIPLMGGIEGQVQPGQ